MNAATRARKLHVLPFHNAFLWTVSVKAGQSELNEARVTNEQTKERTNTSRDLLNFIYRCWILYTNEFLWDLNCCNILI